MVTVAGVGGLILVAATAGGGASAAAAVCGRVMTPMVTCKIRDACYYLVTMHGK